MAAGTTKVTPASSDWSFVNDNGTTGDWTGGFQNGPATAPLGSGSVHIALNSASAGIVFGTQKYAGTRLTDIQALSYSTYTNLSPAAMAFQINYDPDVTTIEASTWYGRLVYEPYMNGTVTNAVWQSWDMINGGAGKWWASSNSSSPVDETCGQSSPCTWNTLIATWPNIGIRNDAQSLIQFKAGSNWNGFSGNADNLSIGIAGNTDTYDFEPPADVYVDDTWAGTAVGIDPDGSGPATSFGSDAFATIQNGVNAVAPNGRVHVAAGTYSEQVTVGKSLHLLGAGTAASIIQAPGTLPDASQQGSAIIIVTGSGVSAELTGFTVTGPGPSACGSIRAGIFVRSSASLNIHDNTIQDIRDSAFGGCQNGVAILVGRQAWLTSGTATIHHNTIIGYQKGGIVVDNTGSDATISDNTVTGAGNTPITAQNGIQVSRGATANLSGNTVTGNSFHLTGNASDWGAAGILLYQPGTVVLSGGNIVTGNDQNLYYETGAGGITLGNETFGSSSAPAGTGFDIYNDSNVAINAASVNFAGAADGFAIEDRVYHKLDDATLGLVTWTANNVYVTTASGSIQRGIDAVASAGTVNLATAIFAENINITKPLTLAGADEATTILQPAVSNPNCGGSGGGSLCAGASSVILVQANDVTIHDLTVDGDNPALHSGINASGADLDARNGIITNHAAGTYDNLEVHHVTVRNIYLRGMYASTLGSFNFHDNVVTNVQADPASIALFAWYGPGVFQNNTVSYANDAISANHSRGIQFLGNTVSHSGSGVHTDNAGETGWIGASDLIQGNSISDCNADGYGIFVFVPYLPLTVNNNTVTNCTVGLSAWGSATPVTVQFSNNIVTGPGKAAGSVGAYITTDEIGYGYTDVAVNFSGNNLTNNETGVMLTADQQAWNPYPFVAKAIDATFHTNQIFNNTHGVDKGSSGTLTNDFAHNWWGTNLGPDAPDNTYGTGDSVVAGILYSPWCANAVCSAFLPPFGTSTTVTSDLPDPSVSGQNVTINFSVADQVTGGPIPAGTVNISDGSTVICHNVVLDAAGSGTCTHAFTSVNSHTLAATFTPTAMSLFNGSSDTEEHTVVNGVPVITEGASATVYMSRNGSPDPFDLTLHATDPDAGDTLTWSIINPAAHGSASASVPNTGASIAIGYTSNLIFGGVDSFVVGVSDGMGGTDRIAVHVFVLPINSAPVISQGPSVLVSMSKNGAPTPFALTLNATDAENDALTWSIATPASSGTATVAAVNTGAAMIIGYAPVTDFTGSDSFVVRVSDGIDTDNIVVHVTVTAANNPPVITEGAATSVNMSVNGKPTPFGLSLRATDVDVTDTMTWSISSPATHGTASVPVTHTGSPMAIGYSPTSNYIGTDSFGIQVSDGHDVDTITVTVNIGTLSLTLRSNGVSDGQLLETGENSNIGGLPNAASTLFNLGDDAANKQYRAILSFNTGALPDNAIITSVTLKIRRQGQFGAANPFLTLGAIVVDIKKGNFGSPALQATDFQAAASKNGVLSFSNTLANTWYLRALAAANFPLVNKVGNTQFRLRFTKDDNNNHAANYLKFFSGNAAVNLRPVLVIQYYMP